MVFMYPQVYPPNMLPVILEEEVFVGRETEIEELTDWIGNSSIVSIVGSPGFGKSTLAIHVGHVITEKGGIAVHYADLYEVQDMTTLKEKLTFLISGENRRSSEYLLMWASKLKVPTLLIFDNCDELLHKHKDSFQMLMKNLVRQSQFLKVMLTAKQITSLLGSFKNFTLRELSTKSAANVLQKLSNSLNRTMAQEIASLVGNVPLALQVVGSLLKDISPTAIANELRRDPITALSPELLPSTERVYTSLNISYHYLTPEHQKCGRLLALFPGSFDRTAVNNILGKGLVQDPSKCLRELQYKSLLSYDPHTHRYRYHQLIKEFFTYISNEYDDSELNKTFINQFFDYYRKFSIIEKYESLEEVFHLFDKERSNLDFLFTQSFVIDPSSAHRDRLEPLAKIAFNSTTSALDVLHICKSLHSRNPLFRELVRLPELYIGSAKLLAELLEESQQDILQDQQDPLFNLATMIQWQTEDVATFYFSLLKGDVHGATLVGIHMGLQGLFELDSDFAGISMYLGLSAYLELYVKLLVQLSKLEAIIHDRQNAVEMLLMRNNRVTELFSFAPANDLESQMMQIKYHSALAHNYILLGQFDNFLEHWKEILQLKWPLAQCKQVGCTPTHLALAHFGQGDYEQSAEQMETLLHSMSLRGNRRVQLFILLYVSYIRLGNVEGAAKVLTKDYYLSRFPSIRTIKATDYVNNSTNMFIVYHRYYHDHTMAWLLNRECMTISSQNYRTCFMLAAFYRSLGSRDATKLGRVLQQALRHHIERRQRSLFTMRWWDYEVYGEASSPPYDKFGGLLIMIACFICILCVAVFGCTVILHL